MVADTYTTDGIGLILMGTGNDNNTWGTNLNNSMIQIIADATSNILSTAVTGGTLDLSASPPPTASSGARYWNLTFTGILGSNQIVKVPNLSKGWLVNNQTTGAFTLTFKTPTGAASAAIPQGGWGMIWCDGANNINVNTALFSSIQVGTASIEFVIDGGGIALTTGMKGYLEVPFNCTITQSTMLADKSGSAVVDVFRCTYAQFDASITHPVAADKITASAPPTITTATKAQDATLTGWTTTLNAGDILGFNVNSATTITRVTLSLKVIKA